MVALAAQVRCHPPVHHALVDQELGDIPCRAGGDLRVQPCGQAPQVIVQAQQGGHGGMVEGTADSRWPAGQAAPVNPAHTLSTPLQDP